MAALVFLVYLVVEIGALVWAASTIGWLWTVLLLIAGSAIGVVMVRSQWRRVVDGLRSAARGQREPGGALADGALVALGAVLMFVPGLVTSVLGLLLLVPPTRVLLRPVVVFLAARRFGLTVAMGPTAFRRNPPADVIDGEVVEQYYDPAASRATNVLEARPADRDVDWTNPPR